jgi:hypothetical protein
MVLADNVLQRRRAQPVSQRRTMADVLLIGLE